MVPTSKQRKRDWSKRTALQDQLILDNMKLARHVARRFAAQIGNEIELAELESEAFLALVIVAGGFKPELGFKFSTYAYRSIITRLWRFMDEWRELTLTHREAIKKDLAVKVRKLSLDMPISSTDNVTLGDTLTETREDVLNWMERVSIRMQIADLMKRSRLTPWEQKYMTWVYLDGRDPMAIAKERGVTKQAVFQGLKTSFEKLVKTARKDVL